MNHHPSSPPWRRLYRQGNSTAEFLFRKFEYRNAWSRAHNLLIGIWTDSSLVSASGLAQGIRLLRAEQESLISRISSYHSIPVLHALLGLVVAQSLEGVDSIASKGLHAAPVKTLLFRIFGSGQDTNLGMSTAARAQLLAALELCFVEENLRALDGALQVSPGSAIRLLPDGVRVDAALGSVIAGMNDAFRIGGRISHFANGTTDKIWHEPSHFLRDSLAVCAGESPASQTSFRGTHLARFPDAYVANGFWMAFVARIFLLILANQVAVERGSAVALLPASAIVVDPARLRGFNDSDREGLQIAFGECFVTNQWWLTHRGGTGNYPIVMRPAMRFQLHPSLFAVCPLNVADSITFLFEDAVRPRGLAARHALPPQFFEALLSKPFEAEVIQTFRHAGFLAGEVLTSGVWRTQDGDRFIGTNGLPTGQIDLVAWHPQIRQVFIGDCKVLLSPMDSKAIASQWSKIGLTDSASFKSKLREHRRWAGESLVAHGYEFNRADCCVILDRPLHFMQPDDDVVVTDIHLVAAALSKL